MLFIFAITIPFDIRDMEYDASIGTRTIPVVLGEEKAKKIALLTLGLFFALGILQYFILPGTKFRYAFSLGISVVASAVVVWKTNRSRKEFFYSFFAEGMMLLQCLLVMAANKF